jgi:CxxC motif-containing protein (DUF1111 family)
MREERIDMKRRVLIVFACLLGVLGLVSLPLAQTFRARDPGVRGGDPGAGDPLGDLTARELLFFEAGLEDFSEAEGIGDGLGPRFNLDSCLGCHSHPAPGGSSPAVNPQVGMATASGARNAVPSFIRPNGPVREARFKYRRDGTTRDGGVHALFVISGRDDNTGDARGCAIEQDDFAGHLSRGNVTFRIPTPLFGTGLIEQIPDRTILANRDANASAKRSFGVGGRTNIFRGSANNNGNDGTIAKFGWKAQNASLLLFSGEAYNVEMGITNELFPAERDGTPSCQLARVPNDTTDTEADSLLGPVSAIQKFAFFMRFLASPVPSTTRPGGAASIDRGRQLFGDVGCALCHTPTLRTGDATVGALRDKPVNLYSDLLLHRMGPGLADDILQGEAGGDEFRTAPLWGLGQRLFLLHDGRTRDLVEAIQAHRGAATSKFPASEANAAVSAYTNLGETQKQDLLNFLRSL